MTPSHAPPLPHMRHPQPEPAELHPEHPTQHTQHPQQGQPNAPSTLPLTIHSPSVPPPVYGSSRTTSTLFSRDSSRTSCRLDGEGPEAPLPPSPLLSLALCLTLTLTLRFLLTLTLTLTLIVASLVTLLLSRSTTLTQTLAQSPVWQGGSAGEGSWGEIRRNFGQGRSYGQQGHTPGPD